MKNVIAAAKIYCEENGERLTSPRAKVLGIVCAAAQPIGAYGVLKAMKGAKPPTVYRALDFWEKAGFIHRIGSLNAYAPCRAGHRHSGAQFLICRACGTVAETHICHMPKAFGAAAEENGFRLDGWFLELRGLCRECATL